MNVFRSSIVTGATALGLTLASLCAVPAIAADRDANEPRKVVVQYDELDLSSKQGAQTLYARLRNAARQVCASYESRDPSRRAIWDACYNQSLSNAVMQVNREAVTALHQRQTHSERAS
jgi:UrcA family protein